MALMKPRRMLLKSNVWQLTQRPEPLAVLTLKAQTAMAAVPEPAAHDNFITAGLHAILTYIAPHKALAKQKHWMRCNCRKPTTMLVREYTNNLRQISKQEL
jgi:hypothetical protein